MKRPGFNFGYSKLVLSVLLLALIELIILDIVPGQISKHIRSASDRVAFGRAEEISRAIVHKKLDLNNIDHYKRNPTRQLLIRFCTDNSTVHSIDLVNKTNKIVLSNDVTVEDSTYTALEDLQLLNLREPTIVQQTVTDTLETFDIVWPILLENEYNGLIRIGLSHTEYAGQGELVRTVAGLTGIAIAIIVFSSVFLGSVTFGEGHTGKPGSGNGKPSNNNTDSDGDAMYSSVFTGLNKLYEGTDDLDRSFQESEQKIHSMMRVLNQGVLIFDLDMNIINQNEYVNDVFKIRASSHAEKKLYEMLHRNPKLIEMYRLARDPLTHEVKQYFPLTLANGHNVQAEVLAKPYYEEDSVSGVVFYIKNDEMINELEQTLHRSMKYGVISQLASSIGHEIRNPLSSLAIHTEIVDNMVGKSVNDRERLQKIRKSITILNSEVERLQKLIDQFFNLAKSQEFGLNFENINDVMAEIIELVQQQAFESNVNIQHHFGQNLPMVRISKDQIKQVIINLILNGFDAMPEGGDLTLHTYFHEGNLVISIADTGKGIPEDVQRHIFDLYYTTKESGGGIGLAISSKIIEAHKGRLRFTSEPGHGTVFFIELPTSQN